MEHYLIFSHEYPPFEGGVGNYAQGVARAMHQTGIQVSVVTTSPPAEQSEPNTNDIDRIIIKTTKNSGPLKFVYELFQYLKLLRRYPHARLHAMDWQSWKILSVINLIKPCKYSLTLHGSEILATRHSLRTRLLGIQMPFRNVDQISVNSHDTCKRLTTAFPFCKSCDVQIAYPAPQQSILDHALKESRYDQRRTNKNRIVTLARIEPRKGHITALKALRDISEDEDLSIEWTIIGEAIDTQYYERLAKEAGTAPFSVRLLGKLPVGLLAEEFSRADLFLLTGAPHPTKTEGFGMVYLEAGLFKLPSVGISIGGVAEAVMNEETGLLSTPNDPDALKQNLRRLLKDVDLRNKLGNQAQIHASTFTWKRTAAAVFPELKAQLDE